MKECDNSKIHISSNFLLPSYGHKFFNCLLRTTPCDLVSDFNIGYSILSALQGTWTTQAQYFSLRSQEELQQGNHKFVPPVQVFWGLIARLPLGLNSTNIIYMV